MPRKSVIISLVLLAALYGLLHATERGAVVVAEKNLQAVPAELLGYRGVDFRFEEKVMKDLAPDDTVSRHYAPPASGRPIMLYAGYYGTAKGGRTGHNPYACYPSAGWVILSDKTVEVPFGGRGAGVNQIIVKRGIEEECVIFWYQSQRDHIVVAKSIGQNVNRFWNRLLNGRDDGAFVRLSAPTEGNVEGCSKELRRFASALMPQLAAHWPREREAGS